MDFIDLQGIVAWNQPALENVVLGSRKCSKNEVEEKISPGLSEFQCLYQQDEANSFTWSMPSFVNGHKEGHVNNTQQRQANHTSFTKPFRVSRLICHSISSRDGRLISRVVLCYRTQSLHLLLLPTRSVIIRKLQPI